MQTEGYGTIMQTMRESWTDERLDDLKENMNERFDQVDQRFDHIENRFGREFDRVDSDIRELRRLTLYGFIGLATMMVTGFTGLAIS